MFIIEICLYFRFSIRPAKFIITRLIRLDLLRFALKFIYFDGQLFATAMVFTLPSLSDILTNLTLECSNTIKIMVTNVHNGKSFFLILTLTSKMYIGNFIISTN